ncbi:MAG: hypothetical protein ABI072_09390 [Edaphobacter sp.]
MDSVRFGRALGTGARAAAKTLVTAMDAATAPNPSAAPSAQSAPRPATRPAQKTVAETPATPGSRLGQQAARTTAQVRQTGQGLKRGSKRFGEAVWRPMVKLSGVLWLELTGVFFGIFALSAAGAAWKVRAGMHDTAASHYAHEHFVWAVVMAVVFGYFCVSSFVSANRRSRRR